jgi:hypothetical protein
VFPRAVRDTGQAMLMLILTRTRGQRDIWQQKMRIARYLPASDPLDRKQEQKMMLADVLKRPNDLLDSLLMRMRWQGGG